MKTKINAIIVDDEESARDVLSNLVTRFCPQINILTTCNNINEAVNAIKKHTPDLVFLDIEMPNYAGYEIVSFFKEINFEIIFVTAYDQYAIKAFEVSAVDYLLKPVEIDRLKIAIEKIELKKKLKTIQQNYKALTENLKAPQLSKIIVRHQGEQETINTQDIIAIKANEAYSKIYTINESYLASKNLKHYETVLEYNTSFFRTHKSWIINQAHLVKFSASKLELELTSSLIAKLSKYRKTEFEAFLSKHKFN